MKKMEFNLDGIGKITRISKQKARKLYEQGEYIRLYPCNLRPDNPYVCGDIININTGDEHIPFDKQVSWFEYYNCSLETGKYPAFYIDVQGD